MSAHIFPTSTQLPGVDISIARAVEWDTIVQEAISGKEQRTVRRFFPRRSYTLKFNFLRSSTVYGELQTLEGFFNRRRDYDSFLWTDPDDNTVSGQFVGLGDGVTQNFNLVRSFGGFAENVYAPQMNTVQVFKTDWQGTNLQSPYPRTNNAFGSQAIIGSSASGNWINNGNNTVTFGSTNNIAPDGSQTATLITTGSSTAVPFAQGIYQNGETIESSASIYTWSCWLKAVSTAAQYIGIFSHGGSADPSAGIEAWYDVINGVVAGTAGGAAGDVVLATSISTFSVNGFYRCTMTGTIGYSTVASTGSAGTIMGVFISSSLGGGPSTGGSQWEIWGFQQELSSAPTPYIPTSTALPATVVDYFLGPWGSTSPGLIEFSTPPLAGASITANFSYYQPVRFTDQNMSFDRFVNQIYENKKVVFKTILP